MSVERVLFVHDAYLVIRKDINTIEVIFCLHLSLIEYNQSIMKLVITLCKIRFL